jgi:hypothetical protein
MELFCYRDVLIKKGDVMLGDVLLGDVLSRRRFVRRHFVCVANFPVPTDSLLNAPTHPGECKFPLN